MNWITILSCMAVTVAVIAALLSKGRDRGFYALLVILNIIAILAELR